MARTHFTLTGLKDYLNEKFTDKKSGKGFTAADVQGYIQRGKLPDYLGGTEIKLGKQLVKGGNPVYYFNEPNEE